MSLTKVSYSMITGSVINALDFGADPTGSNDSTLALQAAIDSMPGTENPTDLSNVTPSNTLYIPSGTYKISSPLVVTKAGSKIVGDSWTNTVIKYSGESLITEVILFQNTLYCELSCIKIDGNCSSASLGAKACIGIDYAAYFTCRDVYCENSTLYGLRASQLWESYFENFYVRLTGKYSNAGTPGAAICFTAVDSTSPTFAGHESNNTTFVKCNLVPYGGVVRVDASAGSTDNISFIDTVTETSPNTGVYSTTAENSWYFAGTNYNFQIKGGFYTSNQQTSTGTGKVINVEGNMVGMVIENYMITVRKPSGNAQQTSIFNINSINPVVLQNVTVYDPNNALTSVISIGGAATASAVYGRLMYRTNSVSPITSAFVLANESTRKLFRGDIVIQNNNNSTPNSNAITYTSLNSGSVVVDAGDSYIAGSTDQIVLCSNSSGTISVNLVNILGKEINIKTLYSTGDLYIYCPGGFHTTAGFIAGPIHVTTIATYQFYVDINNIAYQIN